MGQAEDNEADQCANLADQQHGPAADPVGNATQIGARDQLAERVDRDQGPDDGRRRSHAFGVKGQQRQDQGHPEHVYRDNKENRQQRGSKTATPGGGGAFRRGRTHYLSVTGEPAQIGDGGTFRLYPYPAPESCAGIGFNVPPSPVLGKEFTLSESTVTRYTKSVCPRQVTIFI